MVPNYPPYEKKIEHNGKEVTVHLWKNEEIGFTLKSCLFFIVMLHLKMKFKNV